MIRKKLAIILPVFLMVLALAPAFAAGNGYKDLTVDQVKARIDAGEKITIVDVRTKEEWKEEGHIKGALLMPIKELDGHMKHLDKDAEIILHCKAGVRSAKGADKLSAAGFKKVYNMTGGMDAWKARKFPVEK